MAPRARWMKQRPTDAEAFLWEQLRRGRLGVRFRRQVVIGLDAVLGRIVNDLKG